MVQKVYKLGEKYSTSSSNGKEDQIKGWINIKNSGMNDSGIRHLNYVNKQQLKSQLPHSGSIVLPAYIILITSHKNTGYHNPWEDQVNLSEGEIIYWGDAKNVDGKDFLDFTGNKVLNIINDYKLTGKREFMPPILHFSKPKGGEVIFNGLCAIEEIEVAAHEDRGILIKNFRCRLCVLDTHEVDVQWLHHRAKIEDLSELNDENITPNIWLKYINHENSRLNVYKSKIKGKEYQLPNENNDLKILEELNALKPKDFEKVIIALFSDIKEIIHKVENSKVSRRGEVNFRGEIVVPGPIRYNIKFLGEARQVCLSRGVTIEQLSGVVARLDREQMGIYITTSYYTEDTQQEVLEYKYPVNLINGNDLINVLRSQNLISENKLDANWLESILNR